MAEIKGGIGVEIEHIFPVIKKWLYSEKEIFLREIVSNASDAVTKLRRLISLGDDSARDIPDEGFRIDVVLDRDEKTLTVTDNGIGMTREEVEKYICQIALSGALDFIEKYEGEGESKNGIIGHFGLGFYSAFMVADTVDVLTRSYTGAPAVKWTCDEQGSYVISDDTADAPERGTSIVMHLGDEGEEYLNSAKTRAILDKYCAFMPCDIYFDDGEEKGEDYAPSPVNDTTPLWLKNPSECTDEDYKSFYRKVFNDYKEPLFWIHIKADYPLNFRGILYFPKINTEFESLEGQVKLYYNQVFVADNIKEVIPEYLLMLKGVLDCPELPLNVSRSYLQNNGYVTKISNHITKKVADKLTSMFNLDREGYEAQWKDIKTFVEYGCLRDPKFYSKVENAVIFEKCDGSFTTLDEYLESAKEKHENKVYYATDKVSQTGYISMFEKDGIEVILLPHLIDTQFIQLLESKKEGVSFVRVDAELAESMKGEGAEEIPAVLELFKAIVPEATEIKFESLKDESLPAVLNVSEDSRRMEDMMRMYAGMGQEMPSFPAQQTLILNSASPVIRSLEGKEPEKASVVAKQIYNLCLLTQGRMTKDSLKEFLSDSYGILSLI
ncbi:MAG: molecular chaperone HtpG [Ruminococcaceae bacterium]|nr:molecular chaperone HtpG [Oscillospiraceae bacterium]